jgi:hypothetical protein
VTIVDYQNEIDAKNNLITYLTNLFNNESVTAEQLAEGVKSLEVMEIEDIEEHTELLTALNSRLKAISAKTTITPLDALFISRAMNIRKHSNPKNSDFNNLDIKGNVIVGDRTLEVFNDKVLEEYYKL